LIEANALPLSQTPKVVIDVTRKSPVDEIGARCREIEYTEVEKFYNDGVVKAVTFAYLIY